VFLGKTSDVKNNDAHFKTPDIEIKSAPVEVLI
jgi:hypothetical protein